jgi:hypothetical protein
LRHTSSVPRDKRVIRRQSFRFRETFAKKSPVVRGSACRDELLGIVRGQAHSRRSGTRRSKGVYI